MDRSAVWSATEQDLIRLALSERGDMICIRLFCAPANLEKQKAALIDKIFNGRRETILKMSHCSKSVSVRWMHYDSIKNNDVEQWPSGVRCLIPSPGTPCSKPLGGSKFDSAFHPSEVNKISTRNFWELSSKK